MRPRRLEPNFHSVKGSPGLEPWAKLVFLAFILRKISGLPVMRGWSSAGMKSWRQTCVPSENTECIPAIFIMLWEAIFDWTKYKRQYSRLSFRTWKNEPPRGAPLRIFTEQNSGGRV